MTAADKLREKAAAHRAAYLTDDLGVFRASRFSHPKSADLLDLLADAWEDLEEGGRSADM